MFAFVVGLVVVAQAADDDAVPDTAAEPVNGNDADNTPAPFNTSPKLTPVNGNSSSLLFVRKSCAKNRYSAIRRQE